MLRYLLAKQLENGEFKYITGNVHTLNTDCNIVTEEIQEAGIYFLYIEIDEYTENDKFWVQMEANNIRYLQEIEHND